MAALLVSRIPYEARAGTCTHLIGVETTDSVVEDAKAGGSAVVFASKDRPSVRG
jgi:hypothetical protein